MTYEVLNVILNVAALALVVITDVVLAVLVVRLARSLTAQKEAAEIALTGQRQVIDAIAAYAETIEQSTRDTRHTMKALVAALKMEERVRQQLLEARAAGIESVPEPDEPGQSEQR